jgi:hypothetical protein
MPSPEEARRLWREGKTLDDYHEELRQQEKRERKSRRERMS